MRHTGRPIRRVISALRLGKAKASIVMIGHSVPNGGLISAGSLQMGRERHLAQGLAQGLHDRDRGENGVYKCLPGNCELGLTPQKRKCWLCVLGDCSWRNILALGLIWLLLQPVSCLKWSHPPFPEPLRTLHKNPYVGCSNKEDWIRI